MEASAAPAATYERSIAASVPRIWENVLDWEHLPWLHASSFASIRLVDESARGWRAWVAPHGAREESLVDVTIDRPALRYATATVDGPGAGTEILTALAPVGPAATRVAVAFRLPIRDRAAAARLGLAYAALYERLWSEDEAMMVRRQAVLDTSDARRAHEPTPEPLALGRIDEVRARAPFALRVAGAELRVVDVDGALAVHPTVCPHRGGPLHVTAGGSVECGWHGYRFDLREGRCDRSAALRLQPLPQIVADDESGIASLHW